MGTGKAPMLPEPYVNDSNAVLLRSEVSPEQAEVTGDGTELEHTVSGRYVYGSKDRSQVKMQKGLPPWVSDNADVAIKSEHFGHGIIDGGPSGGTSTLTTQPPP